MKQTKKTIILLMLVFILILAIIVFIACNAQGSVTFMVDGEVYAIVITSGGGTISMPKAPVKDGYVFDGWYWEKSTQNSFTANSLRNVSLTANMYVYAKFSEIHNHIFDSNNKCTICGFQGTNLSGTEIKSNVFSIDQDTLYVAVSNKQDTFSFINAIQVANEATFVVAADVEASTVIKSKTVSLHTGDNVYYVLVENGRDVQLYKTIIRRKAIYKVSFDTNGGAECNLQWVEEGGLAKEPVTTKTGYTFKGWNFNFETPVTNDTVISANWTANVYTVTYDVNGGNLTDIDTTVTYDGAYALAVPERTGYSFNGWRIDGILNTDSDGQSTINWTYSENKIATADWSINQYGIVFDSVGGSDVKAILQNYGTKIIEPSHPTKTGYSFLGWYENETEYVFDKIEARNIKLTAKWQINRYSIIFDSDGGSLVETVTNDYGTTVDLPTPSKTGHTFLGWYYDETRYASFTIDAKNVLLKARWEVCSYKLTISILNDFAGGGFYGDGVYDYGDSVTVNALMPNLGYNSACWYNGSRLLSRDYLYTFVMPASDLTLSLVYQIDDEMINFVFDSTSADCTIKSLKNTDITEITIPEFVTSIGNAAFRNSNVEAVTFAENSKCINIGNSAFADSYSLTSITLPTSIIDIGRNAFLNCDALTIFCEAEDECDSWGDNWNSGCPVVWDCSHNDMADDGNIYIVVNGLRYALQFGEATLVKQPKSVSVANFADIIVYNDLNYTVTNVDAFAFSGCSLLTSVTISENVTRIGESAFGDCTALTNINFNAVNCGNLSKNNNVFLNAGKNGNGIVVNVGENVQSIPAYMFCPVYNGSEGTPKIVSVNFANSGQLTDIGEGAFRCCKRLTSITLIESVKNIGAAAFRDCTSLTEINFDIASVLIFDYNNEVFYNAGIDGNGITLNIGENVQHIPSYFCYCLASPKITSVVFAENSKCYSIGESAFRNCRTLVNITIPESVQVIGEYAFENCGSLKSLNIPENVTTLGDGAFYNCTSLIEINYNSKNCQNLLYNNQIFYNAGNNSKGIVLNIGTYVECIPMYLFANYNSRYAPKIVSIVFDVNSQCGSIGNFAFYNCTSINDIYYSSTVEQWDRIHAGIKNDFINIPAIYYFSETNPFADGCNSSVNYWRYGNDGKTPIVWTEEI